jgi:DNA (cytosine-5)-methyltransferase 1
LAFAQNQHGEVRAGEVFNTINTNSNASGRNTPMVAFSSNMSTPDCQTDGTTPTLKLGGQGVGNPPAVAMINMQGSKGNAVAQEDGPSFTLNAMHGHDVHAVGIGTDCYTGAITGEIAATMGTHGSSNSSSGPTVMQSMQVRRLTPTECERLQGFPDGYTQVPHRGKPAADGPRYKSLGNSMAVPVMRWIGERIQMVELEGKTNG